MAAALLDDLKRLGSDLQIAPFVCGGSVDPTSHGNGGVTIYYQDQQGRFTDLAFPPREDFQELERLVRACAPASFGRGRDDVLDPTYRQAVKLDPDQFATSIDLGEFSILDEVHKLMDSETTGVRAVLHKLNIYRPGGFFKAHRDTPRSSRCVGTLVLCVPTSFSGGEFVVKNPDGSVIHTFDWGVSTASGKVQWCAFFCDCEHEVRPVRSGNRVTLTYVLEHQPRENRKQVDAQPVTAFGERLGALLKDPTFAPDGTQLGFGLAHQYIITKQPEADDSMVGGGGDCNTALMPLLKGADRVLQATLDRLGLQYAFVPVYARDDYNEDVSKHYKSEDDDEYDDEYDGYYGRAPEPAEWRFPFPTEGTPQGAWRGDGEKKLFISDWGTYMDPSGDCYDDEASDLDFMALALYKARDVVWVVRPSNFPYLKTALAYGNQPELGHYFAAACLLVYVPPSSTRVDPVVPLASAGVQSAAE